MNDKQRYAMNIGKIGESMKVVANLFDVYKVSKINSAEDLERLISEYKIALTKLQETQKDFQGIIAPNGFDAEHYKMLDAFNSYVKATEDMVVAITRDPKGFTKAPYQEAEERQSKAAETLSRVVTETAKRMFP